MRVHFWDVFKINSDGSLEPIRRISVGSVQLGPGVKFGKGVLLGGIDLTQYVGRDIEVEDQSGIYNLKGIY